MTGLSAGGSEVKRFWITFERETFGPLALGCGVTALNIEDALSLIREEYPRCADGLRVKTVTEEVDVSTLHAGHVLPNMGNIFRRGIWWPRTETAY